MHPLHIKIVILSLLALLLLATPSEAYGGGGSKKRHRRKKRSRRRKRHKRSRSSSSSKSKSNAFDHGKITKKYSHYTAYELLDELTHQAGPNKGFSILMTLIEVALLEDEADGLLDDFTLFAPNDQAFCRTAQNDLDYEGRCDPPDAEELLLFYVGIVQDLADLGIADPLTQILTYHVAIGAQTVEKLRKRGKFTTYCECFEIEVKKAPKKGRKRTKLIDAGPKYPKIEFRQQNIKVKGGLVNVIKGVLIPPFEDED